MNLTVDRSSIAEAIDINPNPTLQAATIKDILLGKKRKRIGICVDVVSECHAQYV